MSDIYADFGVTGATMSEPSEGYNAEMAALPVAVRDGDDAIVVTDESEESQEGSVELSTDESEEGRVTVNVNTDGEEGGEESTEETQEEAPTFDSVGDVPEELNAAVQRVADAETAFNDMVADAANRGLSTERFNEIAAEYNANGKLSEAAYAELAKVGYTKAFIDSYVAGQEAQANAYVTSVINYAGGQAKFDAILTHLNATDPSTSEALVQAIESRNLGTVKALINLAAKSQVKTFGKPAARTLTSKAKPAAAPAAKQAEGFAGRADMIKAMSDRRYGVDAAYTRSVEQKVINSKF